jgi:hypothetical protein
LKFSGIVVIQGVYKILQLEFVKTLLICFNSPISAHPHVVAVLKKQRQRTLGVKLGIVKAKMVNIFQTRR